MAERHREEQERAAVDKTGRWERAMGVAKERYREHFRGEVLQAQFEDWQRANELERFIREMGETVSALEDEERHSEASEWFEW